MANPFVRRRPWAAALIGFVAGPFIVTLYLNRGRLALFYFAFGLALTAIVLICAPELARSGLPLNRAPWLLYSLNIVGAVHGYLAARGYDPARPQGWFARWYVVLAFWAVVPLLAIVCRSYFYRPFDTPSGSMEPTLGVQDYFLVDRRAYDAQEPERGDLIVFHIPAIGDYVRRIVGLPGDRVQLVDGRLYIDNRVVPQRLVGSPPGGCGTNPPCRLLRETYPGGRTGLILDRGDTDRDNSAVFTVPPGRYFVLGDNRDDSIDTRDDSIGFVPRAAILGRPVKKYFTGGHWTWQGIP